MLTKITHISLFVHDQEDALTFYKKLGFSVHTDALFGENLRWLTITLPHQKDVEIALIKAETDAEKELVGKQAADKPFISLESSDCATEYEYFKSSGITILEAPQEQPWGISMMIKDLYGNHIYIVQAQ